MRPSAVTGKNPGERVGKCASTTAESEMGTQRWDFDGEQTDSFLFMSQLQVAVSHAPPDGRC
jgi:hypothetical protein